MSGEANEAQLGTGTSPPQQEGTATPSPTAATETEAAVVQEATTTPAPQSPAAPKKTYGQAAAPPTTPVVPAPSPEELEATFEARVRAGVKPREEYLSRSIPADACSGKNRELVLKDLKAKMTQVLRAKCPEALATTGQLPLILYWANATRKEERATTPMPKYMLCLRVVERKVAAVLEPLLFKYSWKSVYLGFRPVQKPDPAVPAPEPRFQAIISNAPVGGVYAAEIQRAINKMEFPNFAIERAEWANKSQGGGCLEVELKGKAPDSLAECVREIELFAASQEPIKLKVHYQHPRLAREEREELKRASQEAKASKEMETGEGKEGKGGENAQGKGGKGKGKGKGGKKGKKSGSNRVSEANEDDWQDVLGNVGTEQSSGESSNSNTQPPPTPNPRATTTTTTAGPQQQQQHQQQNTRATATARAGEGRAESTPTNPRNRVSRPRGTPTGDTPEQPTAKKPKVSREPEGDKDMSDVQSGVDVDGNRSSSEDEEEDHEDQRIGEMSDEEEEEKKDGRKETRVNAGTRQSSRERTETKSHYVLPGGRI
jgi:hypothetical protein